MSCPDHYKLTTLFRKDGSPAEVIDICDELAPTDPNQFQAIEYLLRCKKKGQLESDLEKCKFYINRMQAKPKGYQIRPDEFVSDSKNCHNCKWLDLSINECRRPNYETHPLCGDAAGDMIITFWEPRT